MKFLTRLKKITEKEKFRFYAICFLIPFTIMMCMCLFEGIHPFGDKTFLRIDMYHQYFPFMVEFYHKVRHGEGLWYSWNAGLGANFLALYVYYLASPFNWLVLLFPEKNIIDFMGCMIVLKISGCGLTMGIYLRKHFNSSKRAIPVFAAVYALSGYVATYNWNVMWLDCIMVAPLIILGLEKLVKEGKPWLYCIALGFSILTNYYLSIMICIYLVLYFIVLLITDSHGFKSIIKAIVRFGFYSLIAGGMAACTLVPEVMVMLSSSFYGGRLPSKFKFYMNAFQLLTYHLTAVQGETGLNHFPNIYCGVMILLLIPLYIMSGKVRLRERISKSALVLFLIFSFNVNVLDLIWHGMNYPDSLPARQSFLYILLLLTMGFEALDHIREMKLYNVIIASSFAAAVLVLCAVFNHKDTNTAINTWILSSIFLACYILVLFAYYSKKYFSDFVGLLLCIMVVLESGINFFLTSPINFTRANYFKQYEAYSYLSKEAKNDNPLNQGEFTRIEEVNKNIRNDSMIEGFPSSTYFSSTMNSEIADFYKNFGMASSKVFYMSNGLTPFTAALLGTDYYMSTVSIDSVSKDSVMKYVDTNNGDYLYRNTYALPFGYTIPSGVNDMGDQYSNPLDNQNRLSKALGGGTLFYSVDSSNVKNEKGKTTVTVPYSGHFYAYPSTTSVKEISLSANSAPDPKKFSDMKNHYIIDLGYQEAGTVLYLTADDEGKDEMLDISVFMLDETALKQVTDSLRESTLTLTDFSSTKVDGVINMKKTADLILAVPYESGWTLYVDGEETPIKTFENMFMRVPLTEGEHQIRLRFTPPGVMQGGLISLCAVCAFAAAALTAKRLSQLRRMKEEERSRLSQE